MRNPPPAGFLLCARGSRLFGASMRLPPSGPLLRNVQNRSMRFCPPLGTKYKITALVAVFLYLKSRCWMRTTYLVRQNRLERFWTHEVRAVGRAPRMGSEPNNLGSEPRLFSIKLKL